MTKDVEDIVSALEVLRFNILLSIRDALILALQQPKTGPLKRNFELLDFCVSEAITRRIREIEEVEE